VDKHVTQREVYGKVEGSIDPRVDPQQTPLPPDNKGNRSGAKRRKKAGHVESQLDLRTEAYKLFGVDVTQIPGLETNVLPLFSEVGRDLCRVGPGNFAPSLSQIRA